MNLESIIIKYECGAIKYVIFDMFKRFCVFRCVMRARKFDNFQFSVV